MRRFYLAAAAGVLMLGFPGMLAFAQGNVLVPQDTPPSESTGSTSPAQSSPAEETALPRLNPDEEDLPTPKSPAMTPMPLSAALSANPTRVLKTMSMEVPYIPDDQNLSQNVVISIKDYLWGPQDIETIHRMFHISADQIPKICRLSLLGMLQSDSEQANYPFNMGTSLSDVTVYYDGKPSGIFIMTRAMCDAVPLPPNSGLVVQVGDKYSASITQTQCPPPPPNKQTLLYKYSGNGKADCVYQ